MYRTYVSARGVSDTDRRYIDWAVKAARRASRIADPSVFDFVRGRAHARRRARRRGAPPGDARASRMRFQQLTAPVVAKGVEDTAFYRYNRLVSLNEVGGDPRDFGVSLKALPRRERGPREALADTMLAHLDPRHQALRGRARAPRRALRDARRPGAARCAAGPLNRSRRTDAGGASAPSRGDEYLFYQTLLGIWPVAAPDERSSVS